MPLMYQEATLQMSWCLDCHRNPAKYVRPRDQVFNMAWERPADNPGLGARNWSRNTRSERQPADELLDVPSVSYQLSAISYQPSADSCQLSAKHVREPVGSETEN